jgi:hypothetical protein
VNIINIIGSVVNEKYGITKASAAMTSGFKTYPPKTYAIEIENTYMNVNTAFAPVDHIAQLNVSPAIVYYYDENTTLPIPPSIRMKL